MSGASDAAPTPGRAFDAAWRTYWQGDAMQRPPLAWVMQTRRGHGGSPLKPGEEQFIVDFVGGTLDALPDDAHPRAVVDLVQGDVKLSIAHAFTRSATRQLVAGACRCASCARTHGRPSSWGISHQR